MICISEGWVNQEASNEWKKHMDSSDDEWGDWSASGKRGGLAPTGTTWSGSTWHSDSIGTAIDSESGAAADTWAQNTPWSGSTWDNVSTVGVGTVIDSDSGAAAETWAQDSWCDTTLRDDAVAGRSAANNEVQHETWSASDWCSDLPADSSRGKWGWSADDKHQGDDAALVGVTIPAAADSSGNDPWKEHRHEDWSRNDIWKNLHQC